MGGRRLRRDVNRRVTYFLRGRPGWYLEETAWRRKAGHLRVEAEKDVPGAGQAPRKDQISLRAASWTECWRAPQQGRWADANQLRRFCMDVSAYLHLLDRALASWTGRRTGWPRSSSRPTRSSLGCIERRWNGDGKRRWNGLSLVPPRRPIRPRLLLLPRIVLPGCIQSQCEHAALRLESHPCDVGAVPSAPSPADLVAAFKSLERGSVEMKPCKSLRFSTPFGAERKLARI